MMINVNIQEAIKSYPIYIDSFAISELNFKIAEHVNGKRFVVVISEKVYSLYKKELNIDKKNLYILKDGEKEKNFENFKKISEFCLNRKLTREDFIISIGGGVVGDIAGFVASTYMRGINFIQIPTTLLGCVDSSVGGKTAINTDFGKNLVGTFYQPKAVIINSEFLKTLDEKQLKSGLGEIVKYAFIEKSCLISENYNLINYLNLNYKKILDLETTITEDLIRMCINLKISVVEKDEKESGLRRILNFGHTYAHALEKYFNYKNYTHGECVVEGIIFGFELAFKNKLIEKDYLYLMKDLLEKFEFVHIKSVDIKKLIPIMKTDKKSTNNKIRFILPIEYGYVKEFEFTDLLTIS